MLSGDSPANIIQIGFNVYRAGIGLQELFIILFTLLTARFHKHMLERERAGLVPRSIKWKRLTWTLYAVLALITVSNPSAFSDLHTRQPLTKAD